MKISHINLLLLLSKTDSNMKKEISVSQTRKAIQKKMVELRKSGLLPRGYAKAIAEKIGCDKNSVYQVTSGRYVVPEIVEALIELAEENKEILLLNRLNKVLEDVPTEGKDDE